MMMVVVVVVLGFGAPSIYSQEEWKTYLNPEYKFTIQYPIVYFPNSSVERFGNTTMLDLVGHEINMNMNIEPINKSESTTNTALKWLTNQYDREIEDGYHSFLQNITEVKYGKYPAYKMITYDPTGTTYHYAYLQHTDIM